MTTSIVIQFSSSISKQTSVLRRLPLRHLPICGFIYDSPCRWDLIKLLTSLPFLSRAAIRTFILTLLSWIWFPPRLRYAAIKCSTQQHNIREIKAPVELRISIISAMNIPIRNNRRRSASVRSNSDAFKNLEGNVNPYVVVSYDKKSMRTQTVEGSNPIWNEELAISLE